MEIAGITARRGETVFGYVNVGYTMGRLPIDIPINILQGHEDGPTLMVTAAVHGNEVIGSISINKLVRELDPNDIRGTLVLVPVVNTSAFEFDRRDTEWDSTILNRVGKGKKEGTPTEMLAYRLYHDILPLGDFWIDIHSGDAGSYVYYTIYDCDVPDADQAQTSREMALAFGLEQITAKTPWKDAKIDLGIPTIVPEIGGGSDFLQNGEQQIETCCNGITNVMKYLGMMEGDLALESPTATIWDGHSEIVNGHHGGIMEIIKKRGETIEKGEVFGKIYHPYSGELLATIDAPASGTMLNSGVLWPIVYPNQWLSLLGDKMEDVNICEELNRDNA